MANFAAALPGWEAWVGQQSRRGQADPPGPGAMQALRNYVASGDVGTLAHCTARYLVLYLETGECHERLSVALADFGVPREALEAARQQGTTGEQFATQLIRRWAPQAP